MNQILLKQIVYIIFTLEYTSYTISFWDPSKTMLRLLLPSDYKGQYGYTINSTFVPQSKSQNWLLLLKRCQRPWFFDSCFIKNFTCSCREQEGTWIDELKNIRPIARRVLKAWAHCSFIDAELSHWRKPQDIHLKGSEANITPNIPQYLYDFFPQELNF